MTADQDVNALKLNKSSCLSISSFEMWKITFILQLSLTSKKKKSTVAQC